MKHTPHLSPPGRRRLLLGGLSALAGRTAAAPAPLHWTLASGHGTSGYHAANLQAVAQGLGSATAGAFTLAIEADAQRWPMASLPDAVAAGKLPLAEVLLSGLSQRWPVCGVDALPFITRQPTDAWRLWRAQRPAVEQALASAGLQVLTGVPWPGQGLFSTRPLLSAEDLRGVRMRVYDPTTRRIAELLDAQPVEVPASGLGQALVAGLVEALFTSSVTGADQQVWRWLRHFYDLQAWMPQNVVLAHEPSLRALPAPWRDVLLAQCRAAEPRGWNACQAADRDAQALLRANRVQIEPAPALLSRTLQRLGERFAREWSRTVGPAGGGVLLAYFRG